jgi:hypothetical protein
VLRAVGVVRVAVQVQVREGAADCADGAVRLGVVEADGALRVLAVDVDAQLAQVLDEGLDVGEARQLHQLVRREGHALVRRGGQDDGPVAAERGVREAAREPQREHRVGDRHAQRGLGRHRRTVLCRISGERLWVRGVAQGQLQRGAREGGLGCRRRGIRGVRGRA